MSYARFLTKRVLQGILVIWGVVTVVFLLRVITPGDPVALIAPLDASPELRQRIARELGLDRPLWVQYLDYLAGLVQGDMGYSYRRGTEVAPRVLAKLPATLEMAIASSIVAIVLSIPLGVISATRRHQPPDYAATLFSLVGISTPNFWLGVMLVIVIAVPLDIFPTSGRPAGFPQAMGHLMAMNFEAFRVTFVAWLRAVTLPAITLGTYFTALITRLTRSGMLDELGKSYVRAARAKGLPETLVRYKHALRNTLIPIITVLGLQMGTLIGGAVITEQVFDWPGLGQLVINAINTRDWPLIQGCLIVIGAGFVIINILVDSLYAYVNPQVVYD